MMLKNYYIKTYGCRMNYSDSDRIRFMLDEYGFIEVDSPLRADIIILNSCSVRKQAEDKVMGWLLKTDAKILLKRKIIVTGCMAIRYDRKTGRKDINYDKKIKKQLPWVDYFLDSNDLLQILDAVGIKRLNSQNDKLPQKYSSYSFQSDKFVGSFPISMGCDFFCSYCIVPFSRGEIIHREFNSIVEEVKGFINQGGKYVVLVGQNVNSWKGRIGNTRLDFADLLSAICKIDGEFWVSFISSNPMDFSDKLANTIFVNPKILRQLNLAVQSGSNEILKQMNRHYSVEEYREIVNKLKRLMPNFKVSTDIIVGFPNETEGDFQKSLDLIEEMGFSMIYIGKYSSRNGTVAARYIDNIPITIKRKREKMIQSVLNKYRFEMNMKLVNQIIKVLVLGAKRGLSYYNHEVVFVNPMPIGTFQNVKVLVGTKAGLLCESVVE